MAPKQWVGIDVFGKGLEAFVRPIQRMLKVANSPAGLATLVSELLAIDPALIVVEATANWHLATVAALSGAGLPVAVIGPHQARNFARATGQLAKTDPIDARLLAHFAEAIHPPVRVLPDEQTRELAEWVQRRHQIVEMLTAERNRLRAMSGSARADIETHIEWLEKRLVRLDEELERLIGQNPADALKLLHVRELCAVVGFVSPPLNALIKECFLQFISPDCAGRIEKYSSGSFVGLGGCGKCALKF